MGNDGAPPCEGCGGPHRFDTSIPSSAWNRVIRGAGLPDYLCTSCIVAAFVRAGESFEAELYGEPVNRKDTVPLIRVLVYPSTSFTDTYGALEYRIRELEAQVAALRDVFHRSAVALHVQGLHAPTWLDCWHTLCAQAREIVADSEATATAHDARVRAEEREACARVALAIGVVQCERDGSEAHPDYDTQAAIAAAIRARADAPKGE